MKCFDVCVTMPINKITSVLNAKDVFYYTHCFKHVLRKKMYSYCLTYIVLINSHENLVLGGGGGGGEGGAGGYTRSAKQ